MTFAVWPTATAVLYFLGILMHYRMSITLIRTAVMLNKNDDEDYIVDGGKLIVISMWWPIIIATQLTLGLIGLLTWRQGDDL
jgi:hypothetical protein